MITVTNLRKTYRQGERTVTALDDVTLSVPKGSIHGIVGHSGAGKSTLVRCLTLLDRPTSGAVVIDGRELTAVRDSEVRTARRRIGMVFQHANLMDSRTAAQNVAHPLELVKTPKTDVNRKVAELLSLVGLTEFADAYPSQLSGGQKQRVGIARALASDPDVLLCDEPTSALDPATTEDILTLIRSLTHTLNLTVLVITHEMHVVKRICDSVSLLERGRIIEHGPLREVVSQRGGSLGRSLMPLPAGTVGEGLPELELLLVGDTASAPVLSELTRRFDANVNVIAGTVETLGGSRFGRLRVEVDSPRPLSEITAYLEGAGVHVEVAA
ncbi:D-methionine transport system ATP-binding protein [Arthrobacter subterraneus]|uniref:D-methionine transport system ATP-binding protein n=1 Tax=Arthrobacter subterraneus TaxID=335973 RepID=A0A1G8BXC9_9MICC|nr:MULTISPECIES: ATP-binding cassette domain-containing protein [Arthrobacter]SDH37733.1 D-methionine transport system ATP-binding protein [Arthrobacter subterraneus]